MVNPQTQRPKGNSCHPLTLPPSMEEWDCRRQGCRVPGRSTSCSGAHPTQCPPAIAPGTPEPSSAPSDQGGSRDCSSMDRSAHASHGTTKDTQACSVGAQWGRGAHHLLTKTHSMLWQTLLAHELCARGRAGATILPWWLVWLVLTQAAGASWQGLAAALGHRAISDHPHPQSFRAGSLPLTQ